MTMKFVIALIALFAASAMAQVTYDVTSVYTNDNCTALAGQYVTVAGLSSTCENVTTCAQFGTASGHYYMIQCGEATIPSFSPSWVVASLWDDKCDAAGAWLAAMPDTCFIFGPSPITEGAFLAATMAPCTTNSSSITNVGSTDGSATVTAATCTTGALVSNFNNTYACTASGIPGFSFAITQCQVDAPVAQPSSEPATGEPSAQPMTTPSTTTTPKANNNTPKASSAVALAASGIVSVVALLL